MYRRRTFLILLALSMASGLAAQTTVTAGVMNGKKYGITYLLPRTQFHLTLTQTRTEFTPGEFAPYAQRYLHMDGARTEAMVSFTLDGVTLEGVGVPDKDHIYFVEMKDKTVAPLMELTRDGIVRSINMPVSQTGEGMQEAQETATEAREELPDPRSLFTEEILTASSTAKMAELTAREIYTIRESRNLLLRGEADNMPKDEGQLRIMLHTLSLHEETLLRLFLGTTVTSVETKEMAIEPKVMNGEVVARFSRKLGIRDKDDLSGEPILLTINDLGIIEEPAPQEPAKKAAAQQLTGVAYNLPGRADVILSFRHQDLFHSELPVTQFGGVEYLSAVLFNKNATTRVSFDPTTGAILKVDRQ